MYVQWPFQRLPRSVSGVRTRKVSCLCVSLILERLTVSLLLKGLRVSVLVALEGLMCMCKMKHHLYLCTVALKRLPIAVLGVRTKKVSFIFL